MALSTNSAGSCPHCGEPLRAWTVGEVTVDGCDACGGCWFDGGELPAVANLEGEGLAAVEDAFAAGLATFSGGGSGRCPRCSVKLVERTLERSRLALHACPDCRGIWFDEGRLGGLSQTLPPGCQRQPVRATNPTPTPTPGPVLAEPATTRCPHCGERSEAAAETCGACGRTVAVTLDGTPGVLISRHGFDRATLLTELQYACWAVVVAFMLWGRADGLGSRDWGVSEDLGVLLLLATAILAVWYARWAFKTWSIDLHAGGLLVKRLGGQRFVPWSGMHRLVLLDLPGRVHSSYFAPRDRTYPSNGYGRAVAHLFDKRPRQAWTQTPKPGDRIAADPLRGAVWLYTNQGLVTIGPHLHHSGELYQAVRERWEN